MEPHTNTPPPVPFPIPALRNARQKWEPHEDEWLRRAFASGSIQTLAEMLGRGQQSVFVRARKLGLCGPRKPDGQGKLWTDEEIAYLLENYNLQPKVETARVLKKSYAALHQKAVELGLTKRYGTQHRGQKSRCTLILDEGTIAKAKKLGDGNFCEGIRRAVQIATQSKNG
jgi:hypothetical protein